MMDRKDIARILERAMGQGADFAEFFWEHKVTTAISCEDNRIERINSGIDEGVGIRVMSGDKTSYAYTNDLSLHRLLEVAEVAGKAAQKTNRSFRALDFTTPVSNLEFTVEKSPDTVDIKSKAAKVMEANNAARAVDPRIRQVSVSYGDVIQKVTIANTNDIFVEDTRVRTRLSVNAVAAEGEVIQTGFQSVGGIMGFELLEENDPASLGEKAAQRAVLMLSAKPAPTGKMPVVMAGQAGGTMVHEACGHGLEADLVQKKLSVYAGKKGEQVASPLVTVIDDGTLPKKFGSLRYDDEGHPTEKTVLINKGILEEYMYDYQTAREEGRESTGNGRRESYKDRPIPRMRNTYIAPGKEDPEQMIKELKYGLLVTAMGGGQVNTTNGDYVFDVAEGYLVKDGEILHPVRGATLTGNGPETLQLVERVGKDLGFTIGVCGKEGQGAPVSDAQPTMSIKELIIGGTGGPGNGQVKIRRV
ncbi:MAG: microcin-processing peptidase 2 [Peptococcaceae bacterium]|jgi:TldD protein|nr:microcin-processing peptidase 2 [Peptococcaceae bacterium]